MSKAAEIFDTTHPLINFMGMNEWTFYDYGVGFASGFFKKDMQHEWQTCVGGAPALGKKVYGLGEKLMKQNWLDISQILVNFSLWQELINVVMDLFKNGSEDFKSCSAIVAEFNEFFAFIMKHLDPLQTGMNVMTNLGVHFMEIAGTVMGLAGDFTPGHAYELGKDSGTLLVTLVN